MGGIGETLIKEGMKKKVIQYIVAIGLVVVIAFGAYTMGQNSKKGEPLFSNFLPEKAAEKGIEGIKNIKADKIEKMTQGDNSPINTTHGAESPIMTGKGDYRPDKRVSNRSEDITYGPNSPIVKGNNNEVNSPKTYTGISQRHATAWIIGAIKYFSPIKDSTIVLEVPFNDNEAEIFRKEIEDSLRLYGYTKFDIIQFYGSSPSNIDKERNIGAVANFLGTKVLWVMIGPANNTNKEKNLQLH